MAYRLVRTGRTWSIVNATGRVVEGGFFSRAIAQEALDEWRAGTR